MKKTIGMCIMLLFSGTALALPTPQQKCNKARQDAWRIYTSCLDLVVALDSYRGSGYFDEFAAFAKCRHTYFKKWATWQTTVYNGSTCFGSRFTSTDSGTTETDNLSGLVWEKKDDASGIHDKDDQYSWSTGTTKGDGSAFTTFLTGAVTGLNVVGFAGASDWRLPTLAELQTIVLDFTCTSGGGTCSCGSLPCVDPALDASNTHINYYWSATSYVSGPSFAWVVNFFDGSALNGIEVADNYVRAVRGGL